jgi:hypothetical protein
MNRVSFRGIPHDLIVRLHVLPHREQRYETEGDWLWEGNTLEVRISREVSDDDPRYGMLMFVHELVEALLCVSSGVTAADVDAFDMLHDGDGEPGDDPSAPYHSQHIAAEAAERALADQLGVTWERYLGKYEAEHSASRSCPRF